MSLYNLLDLIQQYEWSISVLMLLIYTAIVRKLTSFNVLLILLLFLTYLQFYWDVTISKHFGREDISDLITALWYLGFGISDFIFVVLSCFIIRKNHLETNTPIRMIIYSYIALGVVQVITYLERFIFSTKNLYYFYEYAIPTVNASVTVIIFVYTAMTVLNGFSAKRLESDK